MFQPEKCMDVMIKMPLVRAAIQNVQDWARFDNAIINDLIDVEIPEEELKETKKTMMNLRSFASAASSAGVENLHWN